jgi:FkbM family methyltransferase
MRELKGTFKKIVKRILRKEGYCIHRTDRVAFFESLIETFLKKNNDMFIIQIGANDGKMDDPIYEFVTNNPKHVSGILIEPVKDYFEELKTNYKKYPNFTLLNLAIHHSMKEMTIYRADPIKIEQYGLPKWTKGIASFNKDHYKLSGTPNDVFIKEKVPCISLNDLLKKHQVEKIDLLQIDTEGYDSEIILNLDFQVIKPKIIHFEHGLSTGIMSKEEFSTVIEVLHNNGYELWMDLYDVTAYQLNVLIEL